MKFSEKSRGDFGLKKGAGTHQNGINRTKGLISRGLSIISFKEQARGFDFPHSFQSKITGGSTR
jgi:hypothetical protein